MPDTTNVERTLRAISGVKAKYAPKIADALRKCAGVAGRKSDYFVPKDTLALMQSKKITVTGKGFGARAVLSYSTHYAIYVHENLDMPHAEPTCAKFLEKAVRLTRGTQASIIKRELEIRDTGD